MGSRHIYNHCSTWSATCRELLQFEKRAKYLRLKVVCQKIGAFGRVSNSILSCSLRKYPGTGVSSPHNNRVFVTVCRFSRRYLKRNSCGFCVLLKYEGRTQAHTLAAVIELIVKMFWHPLMFHVLHR